MNLVGEVKTENDDQAERLNFLAELEDLMLKHQVSYVQVGWAFGTPFNELLHALSRDSDPPGEDSKDKDKEAAEPEVRPINTVIGGGRATDVGTEGRSFKRAGAVPESRPALEVLEGVVGRIDEEEDANTPGASPEGADPA